MKEKGLVGKIQIVAFDEEIPTLDAVEEGAIYSTVVQNPYQFGYQSIEVLSKLAAGEALEVPKDGLMYVPVDWVRPAEIGIEAVTSLYVSMGVTSAQYLPTAPKKAG